MKLVSFSDFVYLKYRVNYQDLSEDDYDNAEYAYDRYLDDEADKGAYSLALGKRVKAD
jgi:hypothetical protein